MVALRIQGNWRWEGPLGTPLGLVHWQRASSPVEAGTAGFWRAVGFRQMNRDMGEGRVLKWRCMWLVGFMGVVCSPSVPVEFQCPVRHLFPVSHMTCYYREVRIM